MGRITARRNIDKHVFVENLQADMVTLVDSEVGQVSGKASGVVKLAAVLSNEPHGVAGVDHQKEPHIGVRFKLLEIVAVGLGVYAPINMADIIAWDILPVFRELHAGSMVGTAVHTREAALHKTPGQHREARQASNKLMIYKVVFFCEVTQRKILPLSG